MKRRTLLAALPALASPLLVPSLARAADAPWPSRVVRIITGFAPGSGSDVLARALAERLSAALGQPVIIDNRVGASVLIALRAAMAAPADGHTLLFTNSSSTVMYEAVKPDLGIDFTRNPVPVVAAATGGILLLVNPAFPARDMKELVALVKANPGKYQYGSWAIASNGHMTMEWLKTHAGLKADHVPYKGVPPLLTDLASGILPIGWSDLTTALPFIQTGKVRAIGVTGTARTPALPDLRTFDEQGFPFRIRAWVGFFAPGATPPAITARLATEVNKILATPQFVAVMRQLNLDSPPLWTQEQFRAQVARDRLEWQQIAKASQITAD